MDRASVIVSNMKRLFYVRHGETEANVAELLSGNIETPLTKNGIQQAIATGKEIKERLPKVDLIICSPLGRAYETAKLIAQEIDYPISKLQKNDLLVERSYGVLERTSAKHFLKDGNYYLLDSIEQAETVEDLQKRAAKAFEYISQLDFDVILIVAHGAFGQAMRRVANKQPHTDEYKAFKQIPNAAIVELV